MLAQLVFAMDVSYMGVRVEFSIHAHWVFAVDFTWVQS